MIFFFSENLCDITLLVLVRFFENGIVFVFVCRIKCELSKFSTRALYIPHAFSRQRPFKLECKMCNVHIYLFHRVEVSGQILGVCKWETFFPFSLDEINDLPIGETFYLSGHF